MNGPIQPSISVFCALTGVSGINEGHMGTCLCAFLWTTGWKRNVFLDPFNISKITTPYVPAFRTCHPKVCGYLPCLGSESTTSDIARCFENIGTMETSLCPKFPLSE